MKTRKIAGVDIPLIGQGTWQMEYDGERSVSALQRGLDLGMTHIDTAEMYGAGRVETIVAKAIAGRRQDVYLVSKVLPSNASRRGTVRACEQSLQRLGTDYLDLYLIHWPSSYPLGETFAGMNDLLEAGKIKAFGVSNFDTDELDEAHSLAGDRLACNQVLYHLQERGIEHGVLPWCQQHNVPVVAYSPFGQGYFPAEGVGGGALENIAAHHGATRYQVALAFLCHQPGVLAIPKSSSVSHVEDNAGAGGITLTDAQYAELAEAFPLGRDRGLPTA